MEKRDREAVRRRDTRSGTRKDREKLEIETKLVRNNIKERYRKGQGGDRDRKKERKQGRDRK